MRNPSRTPSGGQFHFTGAELQSQAPDPAAFWAALHRRTVDRIAWAPLRGFLRDCAELAPSERQDWPALLLVVEVPEGSPLPYASEVVQRHYRDALCATYKGSPLADLAGSLTVELIAGGEL